MLYYEFHPLKEEYETLILSVTEIEKALNPQPANREIKDAKKKANTFWVGNLVESIAWETVSKGREAGLKQCQLCRTLMNKDRMHYYSPSGVEDKQFQWLYDGLEQIVDLAVEWQGEYDIRNLRSAVEIDYSGYKIIITGEIDWGISGTALFDCKTAKAKRDIVEKQLTGCYQARYYSWMQMLANPDVNSIPFTYLIFTKQKKIQLQTMTMDITREGATEFVRSTLFEYLKQVKKGDIIPTEDSLDRM